VLFDPTQELRKAIDLIDDQVDSLSQFLHWVSQKSRFLMIVTELRI